MTRDEVRAVVFAEIQHQVRAQLSNALFLMAANTDNRTKDGARSCHPLLRWMIDHGAWEEALGERPMEPQAWLAQLIRRLAFDIHARAEAEGATLTVVAIRDALQIPRPQ